MKTKEITIKIKSKLKWDSNGVDHWFADAYDIYMVDNNNAVTRYQLESDYNEGVIGWFKSLKYAKATAELLYQNK